MLQRTPGTSYVSTHLRGPAPLNTALDLMGKLPTDLQVFERIYAEYAAAFRSFKREEPSRSSKIYVPIDIPRIASLLGTDADELFGRLYYHLDHKYRYQQENGSFVHLFAFALGSERHCINYPYLAAILSEHRLEDRRNSWALWLAIVSLAVSLVALGSDLLG